MNDSVKRLMRDFSKMQNDPPTGISASPVNDDLLTWEAVIFGPENTPWEGGILCLTLKFSTDYPLKPPEVKFTTKMFHPNNNPNGNSPANNEAAVLYRDDRKEYNKRVQDIVEKSLE